jgi:sugar/nucleoside kinase (ribokinase family)
MIIVLGDMIADLNMQIPSFPIQAGECHRATYFELGPGGATNVAIMAARLGLSVGCVGEVGDDYFGKIILEGLELEGIVTTELVVTNQAETPVAGVVVDAKGEPTYLGYRGSLQIKNCLPRWGVSIQMAEALFAGGWAEDDSIPGIVLEGMRIAHQSSAPIFFDPGPGNPEIDNAWWDEAADLATVILANEDEIRNMTGLDQPKEAASNLLSRGLEMVVIKRGAEGCSILTKRATQDVQGFPVQVCDTTGAGDSFNAAIIFGHLNEFPLEKLGTLANAVGAAKVQKLGTGHNVPTISEIAEVLGQFNLDAETFLQA